MELLRDDEVLRNVVKQTGVGVGGWWSFLHPAEEPAERVERAARRLAHKLSVEPIKKTNLIAIRYAAADPQVAAKVLQSLADVYLEKDVAVHRPGGELRFYEQQTGRLAASVGRIGAEAAALYNGAQGCGCRARAGYCPAETERFGRERAENKNRSGGNRTASCRVRNGTSQNSPSVPPLQLRTADNPELLRALKSNLLDLQLKRIQLLTKFEPNHRLVQEVDKRTAGRDGDRRRTTGSREGRDHRQRSAL